MTARRLLATGAASLLSLLAGGDGPRAFAADVDVVPVSGVVTVADHEPGARAKPQGGKREKRECLDRKRVKEAERWADDRSGEISFAVLDECRALRGDHRYRAHYSASVVKVMLMVAYLRRADVRHDRLSDEEKSMLGPMITTSDNDRADQVYGIVGDAGLYEVAGKAMMKRFATMPTWGSSEITAGDQASFIGRIERYVPKRHESYALALLSRVIEPHRWGIPRVTLPGWKVAIKGGWSPQASGGGWRVNQVALLRRHGRRLSVAILTSDNPDFEYGRASIEGVGNRLLRAYRSH